MLISCVSLRTKGMQATYNFANFMVISCLEVNGMFQYKEIIMVCLSL